MIVVRWVGLLFIVLGGIMVVLTALTRLIAFTVPIGLLHAHGLRGAAIRALGYFLMGGLCLWISRRKA
jgi:hypothetical protein